MSRRSRALLLTVWRNTARVAVLVDQSQPFLRPSQLDALVRAVRDADDHDEHDWIEWKSTLDFTVAEGRWHLAKHILGFANRTVSAAQRHAGGYAYLLVGVQPGAVTGVESVDNAELTAAINRYVGPARWSLEQVVVEDRKVVIVIVDPPRAGDMAFTLRKQYRNFAEGTIFVRSPGRTEQASPAQVDALFQRASATRDQLEIEMRAEPATVEYGPDFDEDKIGQLIEFERTELMAPSRSHHPAQQDDRPGPHVVRPTPLPYRGFSLRERPDERSEADYVQEVTAYLEKLSVAYRMNHLHGRLHSRDAALCLVVDNNTDRNFRGLTVRVHVGGDVKCWPDEFSDRLSEVPELPAQPRALGTPEPLPDPMAAVLSARLFDSTPNAPTPFTSPGFVIENTGSVTIEFDDVDVRPRTPVVLPPVALLVHEPPGSTLLVRWEATAENVDGRLEGELTVQVHEQFDYYGVG